MGLQTEQGPLARKLAQGDAEFAAAIPAEALVAFRAEQAQLEAAGVPSGVPGPNTPMPDGELLDANGRASSLTRVRNGRPAAVVFYRGAWCPYCNIALRFYEHSVAASLRERGISLIAVSPQKPEGSLEMRSANALSFTVLSDPGNQIAAALGILTAPSAGARASQLELGVDVGEHNADGTTTLPLPTVALVDGDGVLRWLDVRPDYTTRTEPEALMAAADALLPDRSATGVGR